MRQPRKRGAALAAVLIASLLTAAAPSQAGSGTPRLGGGSEPRTVTLVTGDRVTVHPRGAVSVQPRDGVRFFDYAYAGHHFVIPGDALPLLHDGRLDRRLFDVTGLLEAGYDRRDTLPLLITGEEPKGLKVSGALTAIKGYAVRATPHELRAQWKALTERPGTRVWLDGIRKPSLDVTVPQIGAPAAWAAGFDGTGVKVAVLDTGIDATHPDLAGKVVAAQNFAAEQEDALDRVGHGTHVASTIAGSGAASGGKYKGVAPGVSLLDAKVCMVYGCAESWILAGMQWAAESGAQVVNMSLGGDDTPGIDPLEQAVNDLTAQYGTLFVIAAGNAGDADHTVGSPASAEAALAVGAVDKSGALAGFSSRGPRIGDGGLKPEITGPGVAVVAARSKDGYMGTPGEPYTSSSGTSMATPHVAGAAAILTQQHPQWTAQRRKAVLTGSAEPNPADGPFAQGAGRVDVARAMGARVSSDPVAVGFGIQLSPHEDDPVLTKDVVYHNTGTADVNLQLSLTDTVGGTFSLSASAVTVPAGGSASVKLTADTRQGNAFGPLGGRLVATADGVRVQTPYGVEREPLRYSAKFVHTDRAGRPATRSSTVAFDIDRKLDYRIGGPDGVGEVRLPPGNYFVFSWIDTLDANGRIANTTQLVWPRFTLARDEVVQMDARKAGAHRVSIPDKSVTEQLAGVDGTLVLPDGGTISAGTTTPTSAELFTGHLGPKPVAGFSSSVQSIWAKVSNGEVQPGLLHTMAWQQQGSFVHGFTRDVRPRELATIRESAAAAGPQLGKVIRFPELPGGAWTLAVEQKLPSTGTSVVNTEVTWDVTHEEHVLLPDGFSVAVSEIFENRKRYEGGRTYHERFNRAGFGPALPPSPVAWEWVSRTGDDITVRAGLFGDAQGRAGFAQHGNARLALYRNGTPVGELAEAQGNFTVDPGPARYRVELSAERRAPFRLSTKVDVVWSFDSAHVDGVKRLPVTAIGFEPPLDEHNTARAGAYLVIPVDVRQQEGSDAKRLSDLTVAVSHDDGATWRDVRVYDLLGHRFIVVHNPAAAGFVSLRAGAKDRAGNTVEQTIIRAYEVR